MIYLHIGRQKTGTTAIQRFLHTNRERLRQSGYVYPAPLAGRWAHHGLVYALKPSQGRQAATAESLSEFRQEIEGAGHVVVSSEGFQNVSPELVAEIFKPGETVVVVYLREQLEFMLSAYAQRIQAQLVAEPFADYAQRHQLDYSTFLDRWAACYGRHAIRVGIFDRNQLIAGSVVKDFLEKADVPDIAGLETPRNDPNPSLSHLLVILKRLLNRSLTEEQHGSWKLYKAFSSLTEYDTSKQRRIAVSDELSALIRSRYAESNEYVRATYLSDKSSLFRYRSFESFEPFTAPDVKRVVDKLRWIAPEAYTLLSARISDDEFRNSLPQEEAVLAEMLRDMPR